MAGLLEYLNIIGIVVGFIVMGLLTKKVIVGNLLKR